MALLGAIEPFDDQTGDWPIYVERLEQFFLANEVPAAKRVPALLSLIGGKTYKLLRSLTAPEAPADKTFLDLVTLLTNHFNPKPLLRAERFRFHKRDRLLGESVQDYLAELKRLSEHCEFGTNLNDFLCDRFVAGIKNEAIQKRFITEPDLDLKKAVAIAVSLEIAAKDMQDLNPNASTRNDEKLQHMNFVKKKFRNKKAFNQQGATQKDRGSSDGLRCWRCGNTGHVEHLCRFKTETCRFCNKVGHIQRVCKDWKASRASAKDSSAKQGGRKKQAFSFLQADDTDSDDLPLHNLGGLGGPAIVIPMIVENQLLEMELDTGAAVSIMPTTVYERQFQHLPLENTKVTLVTYTGERVKPCGSLSVNVHYQGQQAKVDIFVVAHKGPPLMGRNWLKVFRLDWAHIKNMKLSSSNQSLEDILSKHEELFRDELGKIKGIRAKLVLKSGTTPKFVKARPVPFSLQPKVEAELDRLVNLGVLTPIATSEWATPIVPVVKQDGSIRICGDYKVTLNPCLEIDRYPLPKIEEMFASLAGGQKFSKLDLSHAYQQIEMDEESRPLLTLNTHRGLFQVNRLQYGVASAPSIFQRTMDQLKQSLPGIMAYLDDVLTTGKDDHEHLTNLDQVLTKLQDSGVRLKKKKCAFFQESVEYLGHSISCAGLQTSQRKVEAIIKAPSPENIKQLRALLGMVNYYGKFLPNLAQVLKPLHRLLEKNAPWVWKQEQEDAVQQVKALLISNKVLAHYDPKLSLRLSCDASAYGIGAVLSQVDTDGLERPIAYASRTLNKAEQGYAQLEKEALSLIFGIKRYHQYLYGKRFTLVTDHQPLVKIFGPKSGIPALSAARLQRWALILAAHDYDIQYRKTEAHGNADGLSRLPLRVEKCEKQDAIDIFTLSQMSVLPVTHKLVAKETKRDELLSKVLLQLVSGWTEPDDCRLKPFYNRRFELTVHSGCILWGIRVLIPSALQNAVLQEVHTGHTGVVRMKAVARSYIWWPCMDQQIEETVASCTECQKNKNTPAKAPLHPWSLPGAPWQRLHLDFAGPVDGILFLIIVDAFSKWPEVFVMKNITSYKTIECLRTVFARFGLPEQIVTDNGASFTSCEFKEFLKENGIHHTMSAPYHPSSNGEAERFVQTLKRGLKTKKEGISLSQHLSAFLLTYRNTPHSTTGESPAMLLTKRRLRCRLDLLRPSVESKVARNQSSQIFHRGEPGANREFHLGEHVLARDYRGHQKWVPGVLKEQTGPVSYKVQVTPNAIWRRHHDQLLNVGNKAKTVDTTVNSPSVELEPRVSGNSQVEDKVPLTEEIPEQSAVSPRYPQRVRKPPTRLGW